MKHLEKLKSLFEDLSTAVLKFGDIYPALPVGLKPYIREIFREIDSVEKNLKESAEEEADFHHGSQAEKED